MEESTVEFIKSTFLTPDDFVRESGLWLLRFGQNIAKPNYVSGPRALEHYSIHFIMDGKVELSHGNDRFLLSKGDSFSMFPGIIYRFSYVQSEKPLSMIWIAFDGTQSSTLMARAGFHESAPYLRKVITKELKQTIQNLFMIPTEGIKGQLQFQSSLYSIFGHMMLPEKSTISRDGFPHWISNSIDFMKAHYSEGINVQDVAANLSLHRAYFSKIFTQQLGIPPKQYLEKLKMEKSLELLHSTSYTINEISLTLGYPDPYTFTHAFSRYYGIPPGKWRKVGSDK